MKKSILDIDPLRLLLIFFGVLILGFIFRPVAFLFFMSLLILAFFGGIFYIVKHFYDARKAEEYKNSMEGSIKQNLVLCTEQIAKNEAELEEIEFNILELREKLDDKSAINENTIMESEMLISGFERELDLRNAKLDFYRICKDKIKNIQTNQKLSVEIAKKKEKLKQLQEEHFDDLAEMERLRSDMDYNHAYIETINQLSLKMAESTSLTSAQELHDELKLITKELREL